MYKIFTRDTALFILDNTSLQVDSFLLSDSKQLNESILDNTEELLKTLNEKTEKKSFFLLSQNPSNSFDKLKTNFKYVISAGGIVWNQNKELLMIHRRGKWDLPKGKTEEGETLQTTAIREVIEECGVGKLRMLHHFVNTYHIYFEVDTFVLKETFWFEMMSNDNGVTKPQLSEGILEAKWFPKKIVEEKMMSTHQSIYELLQKVMIEGYGYV